MAENENDGVRSQNRELADLKREVSDLRNVVVNMGGVLKSIQRDMTAIRQKAPENFKRTVISTGVAYAIFIVLTITIGILVSRIAVSSERRKLDAAIAEIDAAKVASKNAEDSLAQEKKKIDDRSKLSLKAVALYKKLTADKMEDRLKGLQEVSGLNREALSELENAALDAAMEKLRAEAGEDALEKAKTAFRRQQMRNAADLFDRYFAFNPSGSEANQARYMAGAAHFELKEFDRAADYLEPYVAGGKSQRHHQYATNMLGQALDKIGDKERAFKVYDQGVQDYPSDAAIRARQNALARALGRKVASAPPPPSAPAAPAAEKKAEAPAAPAPAAAE